MQNPAGNSEKQEKEKVLTGGTHLSSSPLSLWRQGKHWRHGRRAPVPSSRFPRAWPPLLGYKKDAVDHLLLLPPLFPPVQNPSRRSAMAVT